MDDLISRIAVINLLRELRVDDVAVNGKRITELINELPTAYDIDKVVEEIQRKHCKRCRNILGTPKAEEYCKLQKCRIDEICDIVRKGGVE